MKQLWDALNGDIITNFENNNIKKAWKITVQNTSNFVTRRHYKKDGEARPKSYFLISAQRHHIDG